MILSLRSKILSRECHACTFPADDAKADEHVSFGKAGGTAGFQKALISAEIRKYTLFCGSRLAVYCH